MSIKKIRKLHNPFSAESTAPVSLERGNLEWDEALIDSKSDLEEQVDQTGKSARLAWLRFIIVLALGTLFFRLVYLQVAKGEEYARMAEINRTRRLPLLAPRGLILDNTGKVLARNTASFQLVAVPFDLPHESIDQTVEMLAREFKLDVKQISKIIKEGLVKPLEPVVVKSNISAEERILFETERSKFPGFSVLTVPVRDYINPQIFSHVLGYTGIISEKELERLGTARYENTDVVGKTGIEVEYESLLKGINGKQEIEMDATGKVSKLIGEVDPLTGNTLITNLDKELQEEIYKYFSIGSGGNKGAVVAMNPKTGEILALLSLPGFNNNLFAHGISTDEYKKLTVDPALPLFNRVTTGTYPPGSTVKPMVGLAALEEGIVKANTIVLDNGKLVIPNQFNPSIQYDFVGWKRDGLGPVNVKSAIAKSSDIFFYVVSGGHNSSAVKPLGIQRLASWYRKFGLGKATGIDLPSEKSGTVADPVWKAEYFKDDAVMSKWYLGDTYHTGIGQGDMLVTPLQVAVWTAIIANGGVGMKPVIVNRIEDADGKVLFKSQNEVLINKLASDENIAIVKTGMRDTILEGSGKQLSTLSISSAGKTGTSQFDGSDPKRTHAWFTAYAPAEDPQIVVTVLVEAGGEGHSAAVPIVKNVLNWWAKNRYNR